MGRTIEDDRELVQLVGGGVTLIHRERKAGLAREERGAFAGLFGEVSGWVEWRRRRFVC